jgi:pyruvate dehydrogenase complex dehydrogenase (E1) component
MVCEYKGWENWCFPGQAVLCDCWTIVAGFLGLGPKFNAYEAKFWLYYRISGISIRKKKIH